MSKNLREYMNESILDPVKEELSSDIWSGNKLKASVKVHIMKRLEGFLKGQTDKKIENVFLLGSMTGHQYSDTADIDINFVLKITDERRKEIGGLIMAGLNGKDLPGTKHPINYFISTTVKPEWKSGKAGSIYDILKDKWLVEPSKADVETAITNYRAVIEIARFFTSGIDTVLSEYNADVAAYESYSQYLKTVIKPKDKEDLEELIKFKVQEIVSDIDSLKIAKHLIRAFRNEAFEEGEDGFEISTKIDIKDSANFSINNLIYKYLERLGYFEKVLKVLGERDSWVSKL